MTISVTAIGVNQDSAGGATLAVTGTAVPAGSLILVAVFDENEKASPIGTVADPKNGSYSVLATQAVGGNVCGLFYMFSTVALLATDSITFTTRSGSNPHAMTAAYATGLSALDGNVTTTRAGVGITGGSPTVSGELIVALSCLGGGSGSPSFSQASGWGSALAEVSYEDAFLTWNALAVGTIVDAGTGAETYTPTLSSSGSPAFGSIIAGFKPQIIETSTIAQTLKAPTQTVTAKETDPTHIVQTLKAPTQAVTVKESEPTHIVQTLKAPTQSLTVTESATRIVQTLKAPTQTVTVVESEPTHIAQTLPTFRQVATAILVPAGAIVQTLKAPTQAATVVESEPTSIAQTLKALTQSATATENEPSTISQTLKTLTQSAAATESEPSTISQTLKAPTQSAIVAESEPTEISMTLPPFGQEIITVQEKEPTHIAQTLFAISQALMADENPHERAVIVTTLGAARPPPSPSAAYQSYWS